MVVNARPLKRMKSRVTVDLNNFLTFPDSSDEFSGPFRTNIRSFVSKYTHLTPPASLFPSLVVWQIFFRIGELSNDLDSSVPEVVALDVVEEDVTRSSSVYCDQCRVIGWSGHPVCGKRYHFIIRRNNSPSNGYQKWCTNCRNSLLVSDFRCKSCNFELSAVDVQDWVQMQLEDTTHLLHGIVHGNGYGHLLRVNGREGGSTYLSGCDIMDFWDRLCRLLGVRKISVMDVSKKYGLEYRLLHAVTNGHTWYGNWGFEFGAGSFALTLDDYEKAVSFLSEIPLSLFFQTREPRNRLQDVITFYQAFSEARLLTVKDLFCFLLGLIHKTAKSQVARKSKNVPCSSALCSWTTDDIEGVQQSMIKVLRVAGRSYWVSWRALKGAVAYRKASSELLDYCLKVLDAKVLDDGSTVLSRCNPESNAIEYRLVSGGDTSGALPVVESNDPSRDHILRDLGFLYRTLLDPHAMMNYRPKPTQDQAVSSAMKLLDCKQFVKDYESRRVANTNSSVAVLSCGVELIGKQDYTFPPPELVILPFHSTLTNLKIEAAKAFQEVYPLFKSFDVEELIGYNGVDESSQVKLLLGTSGSIKVRGEFKSVLGLDHLRMERGVDTWTVSCVCGAKDDDGERMLACDDCGVWQHTRCVGIPDLEPVPEAHLCHECKIKKQINVGGLRTAPSSGKGKPGRKPKDKNPALSKRGKTKTPRTTASTWRDDTPNSKQMFEQMFCAEMESPTQSGISGISNCGEESMCSLATDRSPVIDPSKTESAIISGASDDTSVLDTCTSDVGFVKSGENCSQYAGEDTLRNGNGIKVRFIVR